MEEKNVYAAPQSNLEGSGTSDNEYELASRWQRLGASIIDSIIATAITLPLMYYTGTWQKLVQGEYPVFEIAMFGLFGFLVFFALHGYLLANYGQTIGKRVVGIKIVSKDSIAILSLPKVFFLRYLPVSLAGYVPTIGQFLGLINVLFIFRADKRCVHDLIAGTIVVKANVQRLVENSAEQ